MFPNQADRLPPPRASGEQAAMPGLTPGQLHEIHSGASTWAAALAFALTAIEPKDQRPWLLIRPARRSPLPMAPYGEGLALVGIDPAWLVLVRVPDEAALLRAGLEAARCPGLAAVVLESWGALPGYTLVASRRLVLAAERSRVPVILLRGEAEPRASAAHSRWLIRAAMSTPLAARAPGGPAIAAELLRRRGGPAGMAWRLEWDDEDGRFHDRQSNEKRDEDYGEQRPQPRRAAAALSGAVVPLAARRAGPARSRVA